MEEILRILATFSVALVIGFMLGFTIARILDRKEKNDNNN